MAKYKILGEKAVKDGKVITVRLIPEVVGEVDLSEVQEYLVRNNEVVEDVLSAAAWNHEDGLKKNTNEPLIVDESAIPEVEAKPREELIKD